MLESETTRASAAARNAEYLCYCTQTREAQFLEALEAGKFRSFADACRATQVGLHCTACILMAEQIYLQATGGHASVNGAVAAATGEHTYRAGIATLLQRWSPTIANRVRSVCPVISGPTLRTVLCISNPTRPKIAATIRAARVEIVVWDGAGAQRAAVRRTVRPDEYAEIDLSQLLAPRPQGDLTIGSAAVTLRHRGQGHQGAVRPHFKFVMPKATAAVHTVGASGLESHLLFTAPDVAQRSFAFVRNMAKGEISYTVRSRSRDRRQSFYCQGDPSGRRQCLGGNTPAERELGAIVPRSDDN